ncbi:methionyl-tRNA formyltransferase [Amycolatopsis sp. OK19-0408]|uniref:Methionyl-tRNA formyltransferase n=1 Tax=Amycolatopsis iheyensis TaxID=2945988 RepID=A0A9X2SHX8_9PSEU|nr:methionyl-tRNA formyltransferase [Amycolatopsis iheyensis]MCR6482859.1 methionyl-tRNA formyltransferase [Amycolatopsis iheyensis]
MRTAFLGYGEIGATVLGPLAEKHDVGVVITHEPDFGGLGEDHVVRLTERLGLPTLFARNAGESHVLEALREAAPEVLVSANWRTTVPELTLEIPTRYPLNVHDALLPTYAGFGSVNWAIRNGEREIGLSVHVMERELDTGPVLHTVVVPIEEDDTAGDVYVKLLRQYPGAVLDALDLAERGVEPVAQPGTGATFYHRITEADTRIDWTQPTTRLVNLVRGQSDPFRNAWCLLDGEKLYVKRAVRPERSYRGTPGRVVKYAQDGVAVVCGPSWADGSDGIVLLEVQRAGQEPEPATHVFKRLGVQLQ